jgi:molybdate/tungstate transport system substrate-binding protein
MTRITRLVLCVFFIGFLTGGLALQASSEEPKGEVTIFHAGSLTVPLARMEKKFEAMHPGVDVRREAGGSTKMARMISDLGKPADIMASADYVVIDKRLIPQFASWNVRFATNQLVLTYTGKSKYADKIGPDNWYKILLKKGVNRGHSDPDLDPCGYRSLLVLKPAEIYYKRPGLFKKLIDNRPKENVRPKSVELASLLQTGHLDYAWEYLSVAVQHKLKYVKLPDRINLGNYKFDSFYKQATVEVAGKKPGEKITRVGKSCTYGVTLLKEAPNERTATAFLQYMLSPDRGLMILKDAGQPQFIPCRVPTQAMKDKLPAELRSLVEVKQ